MSKPVGASDSSNSFYLRAQDKGKAHAEPSISLPLRKMTEETHTHRTIFQKIGDLFICSAGQSVKTPKQAPPRKLDVPEKRAPQMEEIETVRKSRLPDAHPLETSGYVNNYNLLRAKAGSGPVATFYEEWYREEATLLSHVDAQDEATQQKLAFLVLQAYSKAASVGEKTAEHLGIQATPIAPDPSKYHRSTKNETLDLLRNAYSDDLRIQPHEVQVIDSHLLSEVFERECPPPHINHNRLDAKIESLEKFQMQIQYLFAKTKPD